MATTTVALIAVALLAQTSEPAAPPEYPRFDDAPRCAPDAVPDWNDACGFLRYIDLEPLTARPGARVYRVSWDMSVIRRDQWYKRGAVTLTVHPNGRRFLRTPWRTSAIPLRKRELRDFESKLARSGYARLARANTVAYADGQEALCIDGVVTAVEAVVEGRYRLVYFDNCGVAAEGVAEALDELLTLAAAKSGHRWPFNPAYRGD